MVNEFERREDSHAIVARAKNMGPNRIISGQSIAHPLSVPMQSRDEEKEFRRGMVRRAPDAPQTDTQE
jgi:hypothetical protein